MITRRRFLEAGGVSAGVALGAPWNGAMAATEPEVAPAIARLKSRRGEATPVSKDEREQRQDRARGLMRQNDIGAIVLMEGTSLRYFTGIRWWGGERMFAMVLPQKGAAFYICPGFEEGRAREQLSQAPGGESPDVRLWQEDENPYERLAQGLRDRSVAVSRLGVEETVRFVFSDGIARVAPQAGTVSATPVTTGCRMIKSAHEIALMRLASQITLSAYEATYQSLREGMTQADIQHLVEAAHDRLGFSGSADVQVGEYSALPHGSVTPQTLRQGTIVMMDGGGAVEGYQSDITRTYVLGKATDKMKKVFEIVHRAQSAALQAARPGVECGAVDAAARNLIADAGFGPDYKFFGHRLGHGMGMDGHEWPYLVRGNSTKLAPHMTFSDEPGIYIRGEFGIRLEDDMHITETGAELFTAQSPSLEDPFGTAR